MSARVLLPQYFPQEIGTCFAIEPPGIAAWQRIGPVCQQLAGGQVDCENGVVREHQWVQGHPTKDVDQMQVSS